MTAVAEPQIGDAGDPFESWTADLPPLKIHELLIEARRRVRAIGKNARNTEQNYNYRGIDDVVNEASPVFADLGILIIPLLDSVGYRDVRTSRDKPAREVTLQVTYRFMGPLGDCLDIKVPGESMDMGDKGTPKAMSVALRIALLQALMIPTEQLHPDPDSQSYERADTADAGADRDAKQPSRDELISTVTTLATELGQLMDVGEYEYLEWLVKVNQDAFGVDITKTRRDDGPVEAVDFAKLRTNQLHMAWTNLRKRLNQEKLARERGA